MVWAAATLPTPTARLAPLEPSEAAGVTVIRGAYHVHSQASDGTGTVEEIARAAARAGLSFVVLTDHGDAFRRPSPPRYYGPVLCIDAVELSTTDGHYAALGMAPSPYPLSGEARDVAEDVARLGGFGIASHPDSAKRELQWDEWNAPIDGLEWFNADSQWRDEPRWRLLPALWQYWIRPVETVVSVFDRPQAVLDRWDALTQARRVVGLAAADAHARLGLRGKVDPYDEMFYLRLPGYESVFRAFALRVELGAPLSGRAGEDAGRLIDALRAGHVFAAFDGVAGPVAFSMSATSGDETVRQGSALPLRGSAVFRVSSNLPPGGSLLVVQNGRVVHEDRSRAFTWETTRPGPVRIEARAPGAPGTPPIPWVVGNPIYVGLPPVVAAAPPIPPPTAMMRLQPRPWRVEQDPSSLAFAGPVDGHLETFRRELRFRLGPGQPDSPYVAMTTGDVGPLHDAARLSFRAAASRPLRLSVQVRLVEQGTERRWQRSVYLDTTPRDITVFFRDMRIAGSGARSPLDPSHIETLLFVVDTTNARPGDSGVLWFENLRTER